MRRIFMLTFKANPVSTTTIQKLNLSNGGSSKTRPVKLSDCDVNLVELNPFSENDMRLVKELPPIWRGEQDFKFFSDYFILSSSSYDDVCSRFFALTTQKNDFEHLKPSEILGLSKTSRDRKYHSTSIDTIQVNPLYYFSNTYSKYKNIGQTMLNSLINLCKDNTMTVYSPMEFVKYFEKFNFVQRYVWNNKFVDMLLHK